MHFGDAATPGGGDGNHQRKQVKPNVNGSADRHSHSYYLVALRRASQTFFRRNVIKNSSTVSVWPTPPRPTHAPNQKTNKCRTLPFSMPYSLCSATHS